MQAHGTTVLHAVTAMVENLDDVDTLVVLLQNTADRHCPRGVKFLEYEVSTLFVDVESRRSIPELFECK